jgi:site-specific recombinase XerD
VGSNPTPSIESSVQSPNYIEIVSTTSSGTIQYQMRDLYNRRKKMADWLKKVNNDIDEPDRADILKLIEHMQDKERSILWIVRCITALIPIRKQLGKSFQKASKEDVRSLLKQMEEKGYKTSTQEKFRIILKMFYKVVYGNNEYYPEQVKWFSVQVGKEKASKDAVIDMAEYLEEE